VRAVESAALTAFLILVVRRYQRPIEEPSPSEGPRAS